ncbi:iron chelate uptake ABC transporter family permease subunit [Leisingera sp. F5]|uniref:FecCD family ABC transporter permease n=1 Tax=Leisingera sp. F5 TaxID=1813816 RepID=UPI000AD9A447|nr:iron chelate uptake ABC transporter family permease subunit [Leisingera sp. F5]
MIWTLRISSLLLQISRQGVLTGLGLGIVLLAAAGLALATGSYPLSLAQILGVLWGDGSPPQQMIVLDHRLPRILTALGAGAAFGLSGAMFQVMMRNPLAAPDVIGFNAGASCGALCVMILTGGMALPGAADLLISSMDVLSAADMAQWLTGSLSARTWQDAVLVWSGLAVLAPLALWLHFPLARLAMDDGIATSLGLPLTRLHLAVTATGILLAALAVSTVGPLPFVAFAADPIARCLIPGGKSALLGAAASGALITLLADSAACALPMVQLPVGVFTALIGAPLLLWLLAAHVRKGAI